MKDPKKLASLIVAAKLKGSPPEMEEESDELPSDKMVIVEELMSALESKDKEAFLESLESLLEMCK